MDLAERIAENLRGVRERIALAAARSGRRAEDVTLVGVTKYVNADAATALALAGCQDLGESRPQELWAKATALAARNVRWHVIGHLQRNKVRRTLPYVSLLHSLDSVTLAGELSEEAVRIGRPIPSLLEVKIAADATKHGVPPDEVAAALDSIAKLPGIELRGLMAMASLEGGDDAARRDFAALRRLRDALAATCPDGVSLGELSMGMSGDYEIAIEEGATLVRVGSALFEGIV